MPVFNILARNYSSLVGNDGIKTEDLFGNMSLYELEKETDRALNETIDEIYLEFQGKRMPLSYTLSKNVFFSHFYYPIKFFRCFQLKVDPSFEPKYQQLLSISKLALKLKHEHYLLYILPSDKYFDYSNCLHYEGDYNFIKIETQRFTKKEQCIDYETKFAPCKSREDCVSRCMVRSLFEIYQNLSYYHRQIIRSDMFTASEWANLYFVPSSQRSTNDFQTECYDKYLYCSRYEARFFGSVRNNRKNDSVQIELYYEILRSITEEPSLYKLILDVLMIIQIGFDISGFKLLTMILTFFELRNNRVYLFIVYAACSIGFAWHTHYILNGIINGELSYSQHFEIAEQVENPETIFCFEATSYYAKSLVGGSKNLTGKYLNEISRELSAETIFEQASYLNNRNEWIELELNSSSNEKFRIEISLFLQLKCFAFLIPLDYGRNQFHFAVGNEVLKVTFNRTFIERYRPMVYFLTRTRQSMQFSKIINLSFKDRYGRNVSYTVNQESFQMQYFDKFNLLKHPLALFYDSNDSNDVNSYLTKLIENFRATHGRLTLNLPIKQKDFDCLIDDELFERETEQLADKRPAQPNFKRLFAINHLRTDEKTQNGPDFFLQFVYFRKVIVATNGLGYASLILSLLSILSIWFGLKFLLIPVYFCKASQLVAFVYGGKIKRFFARLF